MSAVESLARTISEPITTTTQAAENIEAYKGLIAGELKEVALVFDEVCELMPNAFYLENQQHIAFIRSRFDSIGELAQDLAQEYETLLPHDSNCGVGTQLNNMTHAAVGASDCDGLGADHAASI